MTGMDSSDWLGLSGRVCVVTGGGGGIGRATAVSLARAGARVAAIDLDERGLEMTGAELRKLGGGHVVTRCDTTSVESVTAASEAIEKSLGFCSVLVNTAACLVLAQQVTTFEEGFEEAASSIKSGKAVAKLEQTIKFSGGSVEGAMERYAKQKK